MSDETKDAEGFNDPMWVTHERAFPVSSIDGFTQFGMTLRDYFAGQAMIANTASAGMLALVTKTADQQQPLIEGIAKACYQLADAMLSERERAK